MTGLTGLTGPACTPADPNAAPTLVGKTLADDYWSLTDEKGKVVLVNFWATWCAPCRSELPTLARLERRFTSDDFKIVGVSVDAEAKEEEVRGMVARFALPFLIVLDPQKRSASSWEITGYPTSVLVGRDGQVRWRRSGVIQAKDDELEREIRAALDAVDSPQPKAAPELP